MVKYISCNIFKNTVVQCPWLVTQAFLSASLRSPNHLSREPVLMKHLKAALNSKHTNKQKERLKIGLFMSDSANTEPFTKEKERDTGDREKISYYMTADTQARILPAVTKGGIKCLNHRLHSAAEDVKQ